jgi:glyoxylase I family protein
MLKGIHHVSLNVSDVDKALQFYVDVLGMEPLPRPDLGFPGAWLQNMGQQVHLLGIESTAPPREQHFAFAVDDIAAVVATVEAAGFKCSAPSEMKNICLQAFTHDPSGNMIEFNQRL